MDRIRQHRVSAGKRAELSGLPRAAFMQVLGERGVPVVDHPVEASKKNVAPRPPFRHRQTGGPARIPLGRSCASRH
ncbi:UPF0175 family protein [Sorangium sp. So ce590]|uniref:UPF0175 family protein n=1 Tax=unclassified Sorangium TaxID=2621164 RepID=UPI003F61C4DF